LVFRRNIQQNSYELSSINGINKNYRIKASDSEPIQLYVAGEDKRKVEVQAIPTDSTYINNQPQEIKASLPSGSAYNINYTQENKTRLPLINNFQAGRYYIQIGSYTNVNAVYAEIAKVNGNFPVAVMKANVFIKGKNTLVHRVLIGPLNHNESQNLFQQIKASYCDAFIWSGQ
jgi:hypothetical protein